MLFKKKKNNGVTIYLQCSQIYLQAAGWMCLAWILGEFMENSRKPFTWNSRKFQVNFTSKVIQWHSCWNIHKNFTWKTFYVKFILKFSQEYHMKNVSREFHMKTFEHEFHVKVIHVKFKQTKINKNFTWIAIHVKNSTWKGIDVKFTPKIFTRKHSNHLKWNINRYGH